MSYAITSPALNARRETPKQCACDDKDSCPPLQRFSVSDDNQNPALRSDSDASNPEVLT